MTILHLLPELQSGGVEMHVLELAQHQRALGHKVILISGGGKLANKEWIGKGEPHITLPIGRKSLHSLRLIPALRGIFQRYPHAILHAHSRVPAWLTFLAWRGMPREKRPRFVTTIHGFNSVNGYSKVMTLGERIICVSQSVKEFALENYPKFPRDSISTIYGGVSLPDDPTALLPSEEWTRAWYEEFPATRDKRILTLPGRLTRIKGHLDFLDLIEQLPNQQVVGMIAGDSHPKKQAYEREIRDQVSKRGLQNRVFFTGYRSDLPTVMAHSQIVLSLTTKPESFGRTILESLLLQTPVVGYNYGGAKEIFETLFPQGGVEPHNLTAVREKILAFLESPPSTPTHNPYTWEKSVQQHLALYQSLLDSPA